MATLTVTPAKAGVPLPSRMSGIPAFAGMTMLWLLVLLLFAAPASAQTFPPLTGRVVDQANILGPAQENRLAALSKSLEQRTSDQVVVVTIASLGGKDISTFGTQLGNFWHIGQKRLDNGVLLIVAPNEHQARITVGYGLEGLLTDARAAVVVQHMMPDFRTQRYAAGLERGEREIIALLLSDRRRPQRKRA